jgi:hypothetical protein
MARIHGPINRALDLADRTILISCVNQKESELMDLELIAKEIREHEADPLVLASLNLYNTRKA